MEPKVPQELSDVLQVDEIEKLPTELQQKLQKIIHNTYVEYCKEKAAGITWNACEDKNDALRIQIQDLEEKLKTSQCNVDELRNQLDLVSAERASLLEQSKSHENILAAMRNERNDIEHEKDMLLKTTERLRMELDWQKEEARSYLAKMNSAIAEKCTAIARCDEIESKEMAIEMKEKRTEQEREMLRREIEQLTGDLKRNMEELQNLRRESVIEKLEMRTQLCQKTEELALVQAQNNDFNNTINDLRAQLKKKTDEFFKQIEDQTNLLDRYKMELDKREDLINLYKDEGASHDQQRNELLEAFAKVQQMLNQAKEDAEAKETEMKNAIAEVELKLDEKSAEIERLNVELANANELLNRKQDESIDVAIAKMAPSAAVASRLIRTDFTLTELYTLYARTSTELEEQKKQTAQKDLQLQQIIQEFREHAPIYEKLEIEHKKISDAHAVLNLEREELLQKLNELEDQLRNEHTRNKFLERQNNRLERSNGYLSQQLCHLLQEKERLSIGLPPSKTNDVHSNGIAGNSEELICQNFVNYSDIQSMQEQNSKLLLIVHKLSESLEEADRYKQEVENAGYEKKLASCMEKLKNMEEMVDQKHAAIKNLIEKCEHYKKLYFAIRNQQNEQGVEYEDDVEGVPLLDSTRKEKSDASNERIQALEENLKERIELYEKLKEDYDYYRREKLNNEKLQQEQFDSVRAELNKLQSENSRLLTGLEFNKEQNVMMQKNEIMYKKQKEVLEERCKNYAITNSQFEHNLQYIRDSLLSEQNKLAVAETTINNMRHELRVAKDAVDRLESEKQANYREQQQQSQILYNLEYIKCNLERSESDSRICIEQRLGETTRELVTERQRNKENEGRLQQTINELKSCIDTAQKRLDDEVKQADKLRNELTRAREEISTKTLTIDELSKKLQESLTPQSGDSPFAMAVKKTRELENELRNLKLENESLNRQVNQERAHAQQFLMLCQTAEKEIKNLSEAYEANTVKLNDRIKELLAMETSLRSRISELESDITLNRVTEQSKNIDLPELLKTTQNDLKESLQKNTEQSKTIRALREELNTLKNALNTTHAKYTNEMVQHAADLQQAETVKAHLLQVQTELDQLRSKRDAATENYEQVKKSYDEIQSVMQHEKQEYEKRMADLNAANSLLHEQMESLTEQLATLSRNSISRNETSINDSLTNTSCVELNLSAGEDQSANAPRLLEMLKYLRKEKNIITAQLDVVKAENARVLAENAILQKKVDELNSHLNQERLQSETQGVVAVKHEETIRQLQQLNTVFDSNKLLRSERDELHKRVEELETEVKELTSQLSPLRETNLSLTKRIEAFTEEVKQAQNEANKWRQRSNSLVEKANKNPEEFKRIQTERENLARMLTTEKEARERLANDLDITKARLMTELPAMAKQLSVANEKCQKLNEEYRRTSTLNSQEIAGLKNRLLAKESVLQQTKEEVDLKEGQLQEARNKEFQLRKIAKKYKDQYELLRKDTEQSTTAENLETSVPDEIAINEVETMRAQIQELNDKIKTKQEQLDTVLKEKEDLKVSAEIEEQSKQLLRDARNKIINLSEELTALRSRRELPETETEARNAFEEIIARMEKEMQELAVQSKDNLARLTRENESLHIRINQLSRQLGLQQSTKPSTSSVANVEKGITSEVRTANVKPMSGSNVQQSATVAPFRGETPFASIRPTLQNSRTAAIMPTSQQQICTGSSSSSSSMSITMTSVSGTSSSTTSGNTVLVPPQQQVHTTGSSSLETIASSSPTSSHTDYMPSTSTAAVAVLAVPPMGTASPSTAECSQEAESIQQGQQSDAQSMVSGGAPQTVALVSPRVEGSSTNTTVAATVPNVVISQDAIGQQQQQQPSTSGSSGSSSSTVVSSHSRHTPSSSSVTTTQASLKRPREPEGDSSTSVEDCTPDKLVKNLKRMRGPHSGEPSGSHVGDSSIDADQMPTSSQRDAPSDDEEEEGSIADADGGEGEQSVYEDAYDQNHEADQNDGAEVEQMDTEENDNNEVDVDEGSSEQLQFNSSNENQSTVNFVLTSASTSSHDNNQQSQAISSGSGEPIAAVIPESDEAQCKHASSSSSGDENDGNALQEDAINEGSAETDENVENNAAAGGNNNVEQIDDIAEVEAPAELAVPTESNEEVAEEDSGRVEQSDQADTEGNQNSNATQSEIEDAQSVQHDHSSTEDNEGTDGVTSEGEKQAIEGVEEEGREAEASISPTIHTRSKSIRGQATLQRVRSRGSLRGARLTPITWQDSPTHSRNVNMQQQQQQQRAQENAGSRFQRGAHSTRSRRARRPQGGSFF